MKILRIDICAIQINKIIIIIIIDSVILISAIWPRKNYKNEDIYSLNNGQN